MNEQELRAAVLAALGEVAPDADLARLAGSADLRDELEIDSMDFLNLAIGVHKATGVEIPEADYPRLGSIDAWVAYLAQRLGGASRPAPAPRG
jgi:acyl carrier protein